MPALPSSPFLGLSDSEADESPIKPAPVIKASASTHARTAQRAVKRVRSELSEVDEIDEDDDGDSEDDDQMQEILKQTIMQFQKVGHPSFLLTSPC